MKHVYLHIQFVKRNFLDHRVKKPSLPLLNFKTGHFALRREENIVEFLEGRFHNQQLSLVDKRKVSIQLNFPFPFMSFKEKVLKCETLVLKTTVWCDSQIARYSHKMLLFVFKQEKFEKRSA